MNRLKGIRSLVTPDLIYALAAASEGELILLAANNFPATEFSTLKNSARRSKVVGPAVIRTRRGVPEEDVRGDGGTCELQSVKWTAILGDFGRGSGSRSGRGRSSIPSGVR